MFSQLDNHLSKLTGLRQQLEGNGTHEQAPKAYDCRLRHVTRVLRILLSFENPDRSNKYLPQVPSDPHQNLILLRRVRGQQRSGAGRKSPHTEQPPPVRIC
jgi:hypothetical protein